tara:strand:- start:614 stop:1093 length:480 start_codon:yes stop_codon:yes gene_type:complete
MSRTYRKYATWVDWLHNFDDKLRRGLTSVPKLEVLRDGSQGVDEVWGRNDKRMRKQRINRARRRTDKRVTRVRYAISAFRSLPFNYKRECAMYGSNKNSGFQTRNPSWWYDDCFKYDYRKKRGYCNHNRMRSRRIFKKAVSKMRRRNEKRLLQEEVDMS